jgi:hypothetical protein
MEQVWSLFLQHAPQEDPSSRNLLIVGTVFSIHIIQKCMILNRLYIVLNET